MHLAAESVVACKQIKVPTCFLVARQHQTLGGRVAPTPVGFHGNRLDVEKQQTPGAWQMPENPADPRQNRRALGVLADQFALDTPKAQTVFLATGANAHAQ